MKAKYLLIILISMVLLYIISGRLQDEFQEEPPKKVVIQQKTTQKVSVETSVKTPIRSAATYVPRRILTFPKGFISLKTVRKHPKLHNENEYTAYWYRYNQAAAGYHYRKPKTAREYSLKFNAYKSVLGEPRFFEIIEFVEQEYPF